MPARKRNTGHSNKRGKSNLHPEAPNQKGKRVPAHQSEENFNRLIRNAMIVSLAMIALSCGIYILRERSRTKAFNGFLFRQGFFPEMGTFSQRMPNLIEATCNNLREFEQAAAHPNITSLIEAYQRGNLALPSPPLLAIVKSQASDRDAESSVSYALYTGQEKDATSVAVEIARSNAIGDPFTPENPLLIPIGNFSLFTSSYWDISVIGKQQSHAPMGSVGKPFMLEDSGVLNTMFAWDRDTNSAIRVPSQIITYLQTLASLDSNSYCDKEKIAAAIHVFFSLATNMHVINAHYGARGDVSAVYVYSSEHYREKLNIKTLCNGQRIELYDTEHRSTVCTQGCTYSNALLAHRERKPNSSLNFVALESC